MPPTTREPSGRVFATLRPKVPPPRLQDPTSSQDSSSQVVCASQFLRLNDVQIGKKAKKSNGIMPSVARRRLSTTPSITSSTVTTKPSTAERNIDSVVLGDVMFRAWYPSYHVKEIIGKEVVENKREMLERLYVCNHCFKYSKELMSFWGHLRSCDRRFGGTQAMVPGREIYTHPPGDWSVWEVDGEVDTLYCQNLSLFAKLFLDNKSVFFDVTGFLYYLLVHTSPEGKQQVVGYFSKEKMSWDNNNLACILIFPPWQRKGLGAILIGVSYEISKREKILGGPEKPISSLGKQSYIRYWSAEVARHVLNAKDTKGKASVTLDQISRDIWICPEDLLCAVRDMGVAIPATKGKGETPKVRVDKEKIRAWAKVNNADLEPVIDPNGFEEGYGYRESPADDVAD